MRREDDLRREIKTLRRRLSQLSAASLHINANLDFDTILQGVLDSARSLTGARYGVLTLEDDTALPQDTLFSGMTAPEAQWFQELPVGVQLFEHLRRLSAPLRLADLFGYLRSLGLPELRPPFAVSPAVAFLAAPVLHRGERVGHFFLGEKEAGPAFTAEDEEVLVLFAAQAALVIANARRHRVAQRAKADLETLVDTSPVGVVVLDARAGAPVSFNREAARIADGLRQPGQPTEELLEIMTVRRADGQEIHLDEFPLAQALSAPVKVRAEEIALRVPDGRSITILVNSTPIRSADGEVESVVVTFQDLAPVEELERLRAEFLSMVSRELRVPLTSIKGSVATLLDPSAVLNPAEVRQFHHIINSQTDQMRERISDLLDLARIETGTLAVFPEATEVAVLVEEASNAFLSGGGPTLHVALAPDLPWVMVDRLRIVQVLNNLLANAARHARESTAIRISAVRRNAFVEMSISDQGDGVSAERLPHLFRGFPRIDCDDGGRSPGGLGLALSKGIVVAHGGRIWAESDGPGLGACFSFTMPTVPDPETRATAELARLAARSSGPAGEERLRILAIDGDLEALRFIRDALAKAGFEPMVTGDPREALRLMREMQPALALLDLTLPETGGMAFMRELQAMDDAPVIVMSAYGQDKTMVSALALGADDYIVKPFAPTELAARIRTALRKRAASESSAPYTRGGLEIDYAERRVTLAGRPIRLTPIEYRTLSELSANAGQVVTYEHLLRRVWGVGRDGDLQPIRTVISRLRGKLRDDADGPTYIFTEPRIGYRMV